MNFGYIPDYQKTNKLKDFYLRIFGYPYPAGRNEARLAFKLLNPKKGEPILDLGCGEGIWSNELSKMGCRVTGFDISNHDITRAQKRAKIMGLTTKFLVGDAQRLPFADNQFTKIISLCTLEHLPDDKRSLQECHRVLQPQGSLVISVPTDNFPPFIRIAVLLPRWVKKILFNPLIQGATNMKEWQKLHDLKFHHHRYYDEVKIRSLAKKAGFKVEKIISHIKFFGAIPHSLIHTLNIFAWQKSPTSPYRLKNESVFALTFPLFYLLYRLDDIFENKNSLHLIVKMSKL